MRHLLLTGSRTIPDLQAFLLLFLGMRHLLLTGSRTMPDLQAFLLVRFLDGDLRGLLYFLFDFV